MKPLYAIVTLLLCATLALAQNPEGPSGTALRKDYCLNTSVGFQIWGLYTSNGEVYDEATQSWQPTSDRLNFMVRRTRLGFKGRPYDRLKYNLTLAIDHVGNDDYDGATGGGNNGAFPNVSLWNAWVQWQLLPSSDVLHLTAGYFPPQFHRESITSALAVPSMEKAMSQNYARRHLVGTGPGRAVGLNIGGQWHREDAPLAFSYDLGLFAPTFGTTTAGVQSAPVWVGRGVLHLGDPEFSKYRLGAGFNTFGKRKGLSLGVAFSRQGSTDRFERSTALGIDLLANYGPFNFKADYTAMQRSATNADEKFDVSANTWNVAASVNLPFGKYLLEPALMAYGFDGPMDALGQQQAKAMAAFSGRERALDVGLNLHLNPGKLIVQLHYTLRDGEAGAAGDEARVNQYFSQNGKAIRRGDWLGVGVIGKF